MRNGPPTNLRHERANDTFHITIAAARPQSRRRSLQVKLVKRYILDTIRIACLVPGPRLPPPEDEPERRQENPGGVGHPIAQAHRPPDELLRPLIEGRINGVHSRVANHCRG